jgi:hypothetical protein
MNVRHALLHEITDVMGKVLAQCEAEGIKLDDRSIRIFCDRFAKAYLALPEELARAVLNDETQHGGLLSRTTVRTAGVVLARMGE